MAMTVDWVTLSMGLAGGLALFLIGMTQVTDALKALGDDRLRWVLARLSSNRLLGATTGALITAAIQSSSATTVVTVGFVSAGMMSLWQSASVVIGSNLGTTVTAQIIAFDITRYALGMFAAGALVAAVGRTPHQRHVGRAFGGLGLVFFGMATMSDAMKPLGSYQPFLDLVSGTSDPFTGLAIGALFTAVVQSSSATTGIVVVMAADGLIDLETGIAIILGANIGTCVTAVVAALGKGPDAMRTAVVHVAVNTIGALLWIVFIGTLADLVTGLTPDSDTSTARQIANAHTVFNAVNTVIFLALMTPLVRLVRYAMPDRPPRATVPLRAAYLDRDLLHTPVLALEVTHKELIRLALMVRGLLDDAVPAALTGDRPTLDALLGQEDEIDAIHGDIVHYLSEIGRGPMGERQRDEMLGLLRTANLLESLADTVHVGVIEKGYRRLADLVVISDGTIGQIEVLHRGALDAIDLAVEALGRPDSDALARLRESKVVFHDLEHAATAHLAQRLVAAEPGRIAAYSIEVELVDALRSVHRSCRRIARAAQASARGDEADTPE
jgi:phosphate:Na+ symporter